VLLDCWATSATACGGGRRVALLLLLLLVELLLPAAAGTAAGGGWRWACWWRWLRPGWWGWNNVKGLTRNKGRVVQAEQSVGPGHELGCKSLGLLSPPSCQPWPRCLTLVTHSTVYITVLCKMCLGKNAYLQSHRRENGATQVVAATALKKPLASMIEPGVHEALIQQPMRQIDRHVRAFHRRCAASHQHIQCCWTVQLTK